MNGKYRNWCFTSYSNEKPIFDDGVMLYLCFQKETCPTSKKEHFQGYVEFKAQKRLGEVKKVFKDDKIHVEARHGTQEQAIAYCKKKESAVLNSFEEFGTPKRQGNRSDLDSIYDAIESGMTQKEILGEFRGHALRYIGMISKGAKIVNDLDLVDQAILFKREMNNLSNASEVEGNTEPSTSEANYNLSFELMKKEKKDFKNEDNIVKKVLKKKTKINTASN